MDAKGCDLWEKLEQLAVNAREAAYDYARHIASQTRPTSGRFKALGETTERAENLVSNVQAVGKALGTRRV